MSTPRFKPYHQDQGLLFPSNFDDLIPENHPVRTVNQVIEQIDLATLYDSYNCIGQLSYHPKMLLKVLIYAYLQNIYSSRRIEDALNENIHFMWLSGMNAPDHNTINRFRSDRLRDHIKVIFSSIVQLLAKEGLLDISEAYLDGTKIEADANKYTFVWKKAIKKSKERISKQLDELWEYIDSVREAEEKLPRKADFQEVSKESVTEALSEINDALKQCESVDPKVKAKVRRVEKDWPENLKKYESYEEILGERNSFSKTDEGATFMRMKDDHMRNGQLKPGYNVQISTNDQMILDFTIEQKPGDTTTLKNHVESLKETLGKYPEKLTADSGYGSEENYEYLEECEITPYVKYAGFHKELKDAKKNKKQLFSKDKFTYSSELDVYLCPMGYKMEFTGGYTKETSTGYQQEYSMYEGSKCNSCPHRKECFGGDGNRKIVVNHNLIKHRSKVKELLTSEKGVEHRKKRCCDVEATFGILKQNKNFKRFHLRGMAKVITEFGVLAMAHNLKKVALKRA